MWNAVIYGTFVGSNDIVAVELNQVGNARGEPYWSWMDSRVVKNSVLILLLSVLISAIIFKKALFLNLHVVEME